MERKIYRVCLAVVIVAFLVVGVFYYVNYKDDESMEQGATLVEKLVDEEKGDMI